MTGMDVFTPKLSTSHNLNGLEAIIVLRLLLAGLLIFHAQITMPIISKQKAPGVKVVTC